MTDTNKTIQSNNDSSPIEDIFGDVIHAYSRKEAIDDGFLVDISDHAKEVGFKFPMALTKSVYANCVEWGDNVTESKRHLNDFKGRLHDVLTMCLYAIRLSRKDGSDKVNFQVSCISPDGNSVKNVLVDLVVVIGPGDELEPVMTIMYQNEI